ncbi:hypothetical protein BD413DRAFT_300091 [Trametes elegans]|nr:hypothetical protein BD413DRAFT_300091 [Trametes elegans]
MRRPDNAYINGIDFDSQGNLCTTWTYRDYVNDTGQDVAVQAGPNGAENNHDMNFAFSTDLGTTWLNNWNKTIADMEVQEPIIPVSAGITIFGIPRYGGTLNQEAQTVDRHVLSRENTTGAERWQYHRALDSHRTISCSRTPECQQRNRHANRHWETRQARRTSTVPSRLLTRHLALQRTKLVGDKHSAEYRGRALPRLGGRMGGTQRLRMGTAVRPVSAGYECGRGRDPKPILDQRDGCPGG